MFQRLLLFIFAPCAALLAADESMAECRGAGVQIEKTSDLGVQESRRRGVLSEWTLRCFSPVARVLGSMMNACAPPSQENPPSVLSWSETGGEDLALHDDNLAHWKSSSFGKQTDSLIRAYSVRYHTCDHFADTVCLRL